MKTRKRESEVGEGRERLDHVFIITFLTIQDQNEFLSFIEEEKKFCLYSF